MPGIIDPFSTDTASAKPASKGIVDPFAQDVPASKAPTNDEPKRAFGDLFKSPDQKPGQVSTPDYIMDQAARAPFKLADFIRHGMGEGQMITPDVFEKLSDSDKATFLKMNGCKPPEATQEWGAKLADHLLGKEPEPASFGQGVAGAAAGAAATGGGGGVGA